MEMVGKTKGRFAHPTLAAIKLRDVRHSDESRNPSLSSDYGFPLSRE